MDGQVYPKVYRFCVCVCGDVFETFWRWLGVAITILELAGLLTLSVKLCIPEEGRSREIGNLC